MSGGAKTKLLVLGAGGRLGRVLHEIWPESDLLDPIWHARSAGGFDILADPEALQSAISDADVILLLAGVTPHQQGARFDDNTRLAEAVLNAAMERPCLLTSSAAVYGAADGPLSEDMQVIPVSAYGQSKFAMEQMAATHPARSICLRIGNVLGADALLGTGQKEFVLDQFEDGTTPMRSYIGPVLLAGILSELAHKAHSEDRLSSVVNVATPSAVSLDAILTAAGKTWQNRPAPHSAIARVELDVSRLQSLATLPKGSESAASLVADWRHLKKACA